jgi:hypothetical protein
VRVISIALATLAVAAATAGTIFLTFSHTESGSSCFSTPGATPTCTSYSRTLVEEQGTWIVLLLLIPVLLASAVLGLITQRAGRPLAAGLAGVFLTFCVISIFSIGGFYITAAFLLLLAVIFDRGPGAVSP